MRAVPGEISKQLPQSTSRDAGRLRNLQFNAAGLQCRFQILWTPCLVCGNCLLIPLRIELMEPALGFNKCSFCRTLLLQILLARYACCGCRQALQEGAA